ncbi:hypothetical protein HH308_24665 [Gordonia sp. TBRC 11910]|uniref:Uncharacterized protein n=1 Tax=Gordonia asplenii TaxID=2725283 RepID=A0A848L1S8_9ACTN|nr:hypothetical protein [Gordonia asplenii]NMO04417.1 hypothetical protein [Gordonia asplenii]
MSDISALGTADTADFLARLRTLASVDAAAAQDQAWQLIDSLRVRAGGDERDAAIDNLNQLFALGATPTALDGPTDGMLVTTTTNRALDGAAKALTENWMPWRGKSFDSANSGGENRMTESSAIVGKLLWPLYSMRSGDDGKAAFTFDTFTEGGVEDADVAVLVINYASVKENPALVIRSIRDELVELVPGAYLGKIFFKLPGLPGTKGRYDRIGYFALRTQ